MPKGKAKSRSRKNTGRTNPARNPVGHPTRLRRTVNRTSPHSNNRRSIPTLVPTSGLFGTPSGSANPSAGVSWASGVTPAVSSLFRVEPHRRIIPASGGGSGVNWTRGVRPEVAELMRVPGNARSSTGISSSLMHGASESQSHINHVRRLLGLPPIAAAPIQVSARPMTSENLNRMNGLEFAEATPIGRRAELHAVMEGYQDAKLKGMSETNLPHAKALKSHHVSRPPLDLGYIYNNARDSMRTGSIRQINKNGSHVLVGETNPMLSRRSTIDMLHEVRSIMDNPEVTHSDLARVDQLLRMARIRNEHYAQEAAKSEIAQVQAERMREEIAYLFHRLREQRLSQSGRHRATRRSSNRGP